MERGYARGMGDAYEKYQACQTLKDVTAGRTRTTRRWLLLAMLVGCGGKTLDGACVSDQDGGWSCTEYADAAPFPEPVSGCQASNVASGEQCDLLSNSCFDCDGVTGTLWACEIHPGMTFQYTASPPTSFVPPGFWTAAGTYSCQQ
jgi:hypothetical protein